MEQKTPVSPIDRTPPAKDDDGNFSLGILEQPGTHFAASRGAADAVLPQGINASRQRDWFAVGANSGLPAARANVGDAREQAFTITGPWAQPWHALFHFVERCTYMGLLKSSSKT